MTLCPGNGVQETEDAIIEPLDGLVHCLVIRFCFVLPAFLKIFPTDSFHAPSQSTSSSESGDLPYLAQNTVVPFTPQRWNEHQAAEPIPGLGNQQVYSFSYVLNLVFSVPFSTLRRLFMLCSDLTIFYFHFYFVFHLSLCIWAN